MAIRYTNQLTGNPIANVFLFFFQHFFDNPCLIATMVAMIGMGKNLNPDPYAIIPIQILFLWDEWELIAYIVPWATSWTDGGGGTWSSRPDWRNSVGLLFCTWSVKYWMKGLLRHTGGIIYIANFNHSSLPLPIFQINFSPDVQRYCGRAKQF